MQWNYFISRDPWPILFEEMEHSLQEADPDFYIDGDLILLRNGLGDHGEELACGQVTVHLVTDPAQLPNRSFFEEQIAAKQNQGRLREVLEQARSLVVLQLLNVEFWWDNDPDRTLRPLQDWLVESFDGVLWVEGGEWYASGGQIH